MNNTFAAAFAINDGNNPFWSDENYGFVIWICAILRPKYLDVHFLSSELLAKFNLLVFFARNAD